MTRAAVYARKSTAQNDVAEEARSVTRQIDGAKSFIAKRGWTLAHIYKDDGISGALFLGRPEFQRMLSDAKARAFGAVVFYDLDRFGRNSRHTMNALYELTDLGISVWDYSTGQAVDLKSFQGRLTATLRAEFAQEEQEKNRKRARDSARRKAEQGYVTGGRIFGYDNLRVGKGQTILVINQSEAVVVIYIYESYAAGAGLRDIALALNARKAPSPRAQQGRSNGWSHITIREILQRPLYRGQVVWGRTVSAYGSEMKEACPGTERESGQIPQDQSHWIRREAPELRIIDADLAARVDAKFASWRARISAQKKRGGHVPERSHGRYLLTGGMLVCRTCGGNFEAVKNPWQADGYYGCSTRRRKPGTCTNDVRLSIADMDAAVLDIVERRGLSATYINQLLGLVDTAPDPTERMQAERERLAKRVDNLVQSVAKGMPVDAIAPKVREYQQQMAKLDAELRQPRAPRPDPGKLRAALEKKAADWRETLRGEPKVARVLLRQLVEPFEMADPNVVPKEFTEWVSSLTPALLDDLLRGAWRLQDVRPQRESNLCFGPKWSPPVEMWRSAQPMSQISSPTFTVKRSHDGRDLQLGPDLVVIP